MGAYFALWALAFISLRFFEGFEAIEALAALVVLGVIFPALAMLATRRVSALPCVVRRPGVETAVLVMYLLVVIAWVLVSVLGRVAHIRTEPLHLIVLLGVKLATAVGFPAAIMLALGHYRIAELVPISLKGRELRPALWMSWAALLMQSTLGRGLHDIRGAHLPVWVLAVATPLSFAWLIVEVGVVEEFFFHVLLQERLAAVLPVALGWSGRGSGALRLGTCAWSLLAHGGYGGSSWLTSFAIDGRRVLDRDDLAGRALHGRFVDANEEFRCACYRAPCR